MRESTTIPNITSEKETVEVHGVKNASLVLPAKFVAGLLGATKLFLLLLLTDDFLFSDVKFF